MPASGLQNAVHLIWHLPRLASWHCAGWLLHCHWILNGNYAVYTAFVYIYVYIYIYVYVHKTHVGDSSICILGPQPPYTSRMPPLLGRNPVHV